MTPATETHLLLGVAILSLGGTAYTIWHLHYGFTAFFDEIRESVQKYVSSEIKGAQDRLSLMDRRVCSVCKRLSTKFEVSIEGAVTCLSCKVKNGA